LLRRGVDQALPEEASAQAEKVQIAAEFAEPFDLAAKLQARLELQERPQPAFGTDVSWRKHVEPPKATVKLI